MKSNQHNPIRAYFKVLFVNIGRSLIVSAITVIVVALLMLVPLTGLGLGKHIKASFIVALIAGAVVLFIALSLLQNKAPFDDAYIFDNCRRLKMFPVFFAMSFHLLLGGGIIALVFYYYGDIVAFLLAKGNETFTISFYAVLVGVFCASQIIYFIVVFVVIDCSTHCSACGHMFCNVKGSAAGSRSQTYTQGKTEKHREQVGSVSYQGKKVAEIYGDVQSHSYREVTKTTTRYNYDCYWCGEKSQQEETTTERGNWK